MKIARLILAIAFAALLATTCEAQSPTPSPCPSELEAWGQCMGNAGLTESDVQACLDCHFAYRDTITETTTCSDLAEMICSSVQDCSTVCGSCGREIVDYEVCFAEIAVGAGCFEGCSSGPSPSSPTAPAPTPTTPTPPAPSPSAPSSPTTGGTQCPDEQADFAQCIISSLGDIDTCGECINAFSGAFYPTSPDMCAAYEPFLCLEVSSCPSCGTCLAENVAWTNCLLESTCDTFTCSSAPTSPSPPSAPAPAPSTPTPPTLSTTAPSSPTTAPTPCPDEAAAWTACVQSMGDAATCQSCVAAYYPESVSTCEEANQLECGLVQACPDCGGVVCQDEQLAYVSCLNAEQCDPFTCTSSSPVTTAPAPVPTAPTAVPALAPSPVSEATSSPTLYAAEELTPTPKPANAGGEDDDGDGGEDNDGNEDACAAELDDVQDCLATELTQSEAADCQTCVNNAMDDSDTSTGRQQQGVLSCQDLNGAWCPALSSACQCGACLQKVRGYADCVVDDATQACQLDCSEQGSSPNPSTSTSGGLASFSGRSVRSGAAWMLVGSLLLTWV